MGFGEISVTIIALHITVKKHHVKEQMERAVFVRKIIGEIIVTHPAMLRIALVIFFAVKRLVQDVLNVQQENGTNFATNRALIIVCVGAKCLTGSVTVVLVVLVGHFAIFPATVVFVMFVQLGNGELNARRIVPRTAPLDVV